MGDKGQLKTFLTSISNHKGDLANVTAPPYVLASKSAVEFPASWAELPGMLCAPAKEQDPAERARLVLKWYLGSLKRQQYSSGSEEDGVKKPLNAFLGELFIGSFKDEDGQGETKMITEQVSHHPPVTACHIWNDRAGVRAEGYTAQSITLAKSTFTLKITQTGHALIHLDGLQEAYLVTLPTLTIKGLLGSGKPYPELMDESYIVSSTGFTSKISYSGTSFFGSGNKNGVKASTYQTADPTNIFFEVEGAWNDTFTFFDVRKDSNGKGARKEIETFDTHSVKPTPLTIAPTSEQDPFESRRAWSSVLDAIAADDWSGTDVAKSKIEEAQRAQRAKEDKVGRKWEPLFFRTVEQNPVFDALAKGIAYQEEKAKTAGVWVFDVEKLKEGNVSVGRPFHGDNRPDVA